MNRQANWGCELRSLPEEPYENFWMRPSLAR